ncbi:peptidase [Bifidobacterium sp.]|uniref:peptidase n=1 Tax=Bifidobacterium sp. TaxID=41200 RepID=UPI0025B91CF2|nr:peptidase [Bifidobacterium sp.]MCH4209973.1 peptidase [Bifidobacterium sp.]MCI1225544.1 peptidase [Bifidobacterium sp.]
MNTTLRNRPAAILAVLATILLTVCLPTVARAADLRRTDNSRYLTYTAGGSTQYLGVIAQDDDSDYYCIESGSSATYRIDEVRKIAATDDSRRLAWLIDRYQGGSDRLAYAAIGLLAHDLYELDKATWRSRRVAAVRTIDGILERADELWHEAGANAPADAKITQRYAQGLRQGVVTALVVNAAGAPVAGVPYTLTLDGPARFDNGLNAVNGISGSQAVEYRWQATEAGEVSATVSYGSHMLEQIVSGQDFVRSRAKESKVGAAAFKARKDFTPSLATRVSAKIVDAGQVVADEVTAGVRGADSYWPDGLQLAARGWYFDRLVAGALKEGVPAHKGETAQAFLKRLESMGHKPVAYGAASFTGPDQRVNVQATVKPGGSEPYRAPTTAGFGTWVWAFERESLSEQARAYVLADVVTPFLEAAETNLHRAVVSVRSSVGEHSANLGSKLDDAITVSGFPDDHGSFAGSAEFGFDPDRPHAQVSVWWAGDADNAENDEQYRPDRTEEPKHDKHHQLVGTWDYPAANGTFRVGSGAPDAYGKPVNIRAERHGWYVFVWRFAGDDRVMPAVSAYDDAWERTRVADAVPHKPPVITTQVDRPKVKLNEPFKDVARVVGDIEAGSTVEFSAYEAVARGVKPDADATLLDGERVRLDHIVGDQQVSSSKVRSAKPGFVYWKATVFSPKGDVLATHELGAHGEVVEVVNDSSSPPSLPGRPAELARTGSSVLAFAGIGVTAALVGVMMVAVIRRRS